jgi:hypothetical protein
MAFDYYDVQRAANNAGGAGNQITPEERQMNRTRRLINAAQQTNYDGDPEYYQQIKGLALQAGIPIKAFKSNPFRLAKTGLLSALDTALLGLVPNDMYTPMNEAERNAAAVGAVGGALLPWGAPARLFQAGSAALKASKFTASGPWKAAIDAFMRRNPGVSKEVAEQAVKSGAGTGSKVLDDAIQAGGKPFMPKGGGTPNINQTLQGGAAPKTGGGWKPPEQAVGAGWKPPKPGVTKIKRSKADTDKVNKARENLSSTQAKEQAQTVSKPKVSRKEKKKIKEQGSEQQVKDWKSAANKQGANIKVTKQGVPKKGSSEEARVKALMDKGTLKKYNKSKSRPAKAKIIRDWIATKGKNWKITVV